MTCSKSQLILKVCQLSDAKNWDEAKKEWALETIYRKKGGTCACGHQPITDHCKIKNVFNYNTLIVGNVCVELFEGEMERLSKNIFGNLTKIQLDPMNTRANEAFILFCHQRLILSDKEAGMYLNCWRKRSRVSDGQQTYMTIVNYKIKTALGHEPRICHRCNGSVFARKSKKGNTYFQCCDNFI